VSINAEGHFVAALNIELISHDELRVEQKAVREAIRNPLVAEARDRSFNKFAAPQPMLADKNKKARYRIRFRARRYV
jgi:hypothetical protein